MHRMSESSESAVKRTIETKLGIPYEEFNDMDIDEQIKIIAEYRKKNKQNNGMVLHMVGTGEHSFFRKVKKGTLVMIGSGNDAIFVIAGETPEDSEKKLEERLTGLTSVTGKARSRVFSLFRK